MARIQTGNYQQDVKNPVFREAEDVVMRAFRALLPPGFEIIDLRHLNRHGDFLVRETATGQEWLFDVKQDQYYPKRHRFAWESHMINRDGSITQGWGSNPELDYIVFVAQEEESKPWEEGRKPWTAWIVDAQGFRELVSRLKQRYSPEQLKVAQVFNFQHEDTDGRKADGWAVPLSLMKEAGIVHREFALD